MKYSIRYVTEYRYDSPVFDQHNALRVRPAVTATQRVDAFELRIDPAARLHSYTDYFGTEVIEFNLIDGHDRLSIEARARVTNEQPQPPAAGTWDGLATTGTARPRASSCCPRVSSPRARRSRTWWRPSGATARPRRLPR